MKRLPYIVSVFILTLFPSVGYGWGVVGIGGGGGGGGGGSCSSPSIQDENLNVGTETGFISSDEWGQSWTSSVSKNLYSVSIYIGVSDGSETVTMRIGTDPDLSGTCGGANNCKASVADTLTGSSGYWHEFVLDAGDRFALSASSVYYFILQTNDTFDIGEQNAGYANGTQYFDATTDWDLTGDSNTYDLGFKVKTCE